MVAVMTTHAKVPHFAFPFRVERNGSVGVLEQDVLDEVAQSVRVLLMTRQGERLEVPDYGIRDLVFTVDVDYGAMTAEILEWEPRASVVIDSDVDALDELVRTVQTRVAAGEEGS